jgi:queuine tRNA-ribosyltransferase
VGEGEAVLNSTAELTARLLPENRPRYLMGVGRPEDLMFAVGCGYDLFDCVLPTRNARRGTLFTARGKLSIKRAEFTRDPRPVDDACGCYCCRNFSRAYLRHLFVSGEILAARLLSLHNVHFYHWLMAESRAAIREGRFQNWQREFEKRYSEISSRNPEEDVEKDGIRAADMTEDSDF